MKKIDFIYVGVGTGSRLVILYLNLCFIVKIFLKEEADVVLTLGTSKYLI